LGLEALDLLGSKVTNTGLEELAHLDRLTALDLGGDDGIAESGYGGRPTAFAAPFERLIWAPASPRCRMTFFDLVLQTGASLHRTGEPDEFIFTFTGYIVAAGDDDVRRRVGKVPAYRINAELAANCWESLFEVCDAPSALHVVHILLYEHDGYELKPAITDQFGDDGVAWTCWPRESSSTRRAAVAAWSFHSLLHYGPTPTPCPAGSRRGAGSAA
jgi:hypothetical protein